MYYGLNQTRIKETKMSTRVRIEVKNQFGTWVTCQEVLNNQQSIKSGFEWALNHNPIGKASKQARAVDMQTGAMVDMAYG